MAPKILRVYVTFATENTCGSSWYIGPGPDHVLPLLSEEKSLVYQVQYYWFWYRI